MQNPDRERQLPARLFEVFASLLLLCGSCYVFYTMAGRVGSDISIHTVWASEGVFSEPDTFFHHGAHPMWHVLVALLTRTGIPLQLSSAIVTAVCKALQLPLCVWVMEQAAPGRLSRTVRVILSLVCLTVSCLRVSFYNPQVYLGVGTPNCWHSCTQTIAICWMLLCVSKVAQSYDAFEFRLLRGETDPILPWRNQLLMGALLLLSLFAKPTFMQAFLPASCLFFLWQWIRHPCAPRYFWQTIVCVLPSALMMIAQYLYYFGIIVPSQGNMILEFSFVKLWSTLLNSLLMLAFPIYALFVTRRQKRGTLFYLTLWMNVVGILEFLILGEDGRRALDGNFGWGMMGAALMAWAVMLPRFFSEVRNRFRPEQLPGFLLLLWHLGSGIYYLVYLLSANVLQ